MRPSGSASTPTGAWSDHRPAHARCGCRGGGCGPGSLHRALAAGPRFDASKGSEAAFITTVARRRIIDRLRRLKRRPETELLPEALPVQDETSPEQALDAADDARRALEALAQRGDNQQHMIRLAVLQGMTHSEIAAATGVPLGTVKSHVRRGLMRLREMLEPTSAGGGA